MLVMVKCNLFQETDDLQAAVVLGVCVCLCVFIFSVCVFIFSVCVCVCIYFQCLCVYLFSVCVFVCSGARAWGAGGASAGGDRGSARWCGDTLRSAGERRRGPDRSEPAAERHTEGAGDKPRPRTGVWAGHQLTARQRGHPALSGQNCCWWITIFRVLVFTQHEAVQLLFSTWASSQIRSVCV